MSKRSCCTYLLLAYHSTTNCSRAAVLSNPRVLWCSKSVVGQFQSMQRLSMSSSTETDDDVAANLKSVLTTIKGVCEKANLAASSIRLVAVSKTKPIELLQQAYDAGCRVFGENYAQELVDKVPQLPVDVSWHFIGNLQSNKANMLISCFDGTHDRLTVETVDKIKLANKLDKAVADSANSEIKLKVYVQVNTSGEGSKSGCEPSEVVDACQHVTSNCPHLELRGLMTIGAPGDLSAFGILKECRDKVQEAVVVGGSSDLDLSMGMSSDYVEAIQAGATNVRVGSTIFGARDYSK